MAIPAVAVMITDLNFSVALMILKLYNRYMAIAVPKVKPTAFKTMPGATAANAALDPERLGGVEVGLDFAPLNTARAGITLFWNRLDNAIGNVTLGTGPGVFPQVGFVAAGGAFRQRLNLDSIRVQGVEAAAALDYGHWRLSGSTY